MLNLKLLIGIALVLMLCISPVAAVSATPVAAVSADDFEIVHDDSQYFDTYKYRDLNNPDEKYIYIHTKGTTWLSSLVTFKPANIPDAPVMEVNTISERDIYLTNTVDEWEIKFYSRFWYKPTLEGKYLKNSGVVNLKEYFKNCISDGLYLQLCWGQYIAGSREITTGIRYSIPDV